MSLKHKSLLLVCILAILTTCLGQNIQADGSTPDKSNPKPQLELPYMAFAYCDLENVWNTRSIEKSIEILKGFPYVICAQPGTICDDERYVTEMIKTEVKLFGYINMGETPLVSLDKLKKEIDIIAEAKWYGVFIDQFGYDFKETRSRQNEIVDYTHKKGLKCFVNAWFIDDALGSAVDKVHNPKGLKPLLGEGDWYLLESFFVTGDGYIRDADSMLKKYDKAKAFKEKTGINIACLSYKRKKVAWSKSGEDIKMSYTMALLYGFDGWWFGDNLSDDRFLFGGKPVFDFGSTLVEKMYVNGIKKYRARTELYIFDFYFANYPPPKLVMNRNKK